MKTVFLLTFTITILAQSIVHAEVVKVAADDGVTVTIVYEKQLWHGDAEQPFANFVQVILEKGSYPLLYGKKVEGEVQESYNQYNGKFGNNEDVVNHHQISFSNQNDGLCVGSLRRNYLWLWRTNADVKVRFNSLEHQLKITVDGRPVTFNGRDSTHIVLP